MEGARSAEPPTSSGTLSAMALSTAPEAARVAICPPTSNCGRARSQPSGSFPASVLWNSAAGSWSSLAYADSVPFHSRWASSPASSARRNTASASSGTVNDSSYGQPRFRLVASTSSSPRGAPCAAAVSCLLGEPYAMWVLITTSVGCSPPVRASSITLSISVMSFPSSIRRTCQP